MAVAGLAWGLALLTKIHAWFLPPVVLVWCPGPAGRAGRGGCVGLAGGRAWTIFFAGWPWLWSDPVGRLRAYLGTGVERVSIRVLYFGRVFADRDVPWHYPWVYFAATVPVGLQALGVWGLVRGWRERGGRPVPAPAGRVDRAVPGPVQHPDPGLRRRAAVPGRLPPVAILIGRGFAALWDAAGPAGVGWPWSALMVGQGYGVVDDPPVRPELLQRPGRRPARAPSGSGWS